MLPDRFGALKAVAYSSMKLSRYISECEMSMDLLVAEAVLEFGDNPREAGRNVDLVGGGDPLWWNSCVANPLARWRVLHHVLLRSACNSYPFQYILDYEQTQLYLLIGA